MIFFFFFLKINPSNNKTTTKEETVGSCYHTHTQNCVSVMFGLVWFPTEFPLYRSHYTQKKVPVKSIYGKKWQNDDDVMVVVNIQKHTSSLLSKFFIIKSSCRRLFWVPMRNVKKRVFAHMTERIIRKSLRNIPFFTSLSIIFASFFLFCFS